MDFLYELLLLYTIIVIYVFTIITIVTIIIIIIIIIITGPGRGPAWLINHAAAAAEPGHASHGGDQEHDNKYIYIYI